MPRRGLFPSTRVEGNTSTRVEGNNPRLGFWVSGLGPRACEGNSPCLGFWVSGLGPRACEGHRSPGEGYCCGGWSSGFRRTSRIRVL